MRVCIENIKPGMSPYNGKGKFAMRLVKEFRKTGVEIASPETADVNFRMNALPSSSHGVSVLG